MLKLYGRNWPNDFTKRFFVGMHMTDKDQNSGAGPTLHRFDAKDFVGKLADTGCDTLYFYMSCHIGNCYYPSKVKYARVHSAMQGRDFLDETIAECQKHKIALVAVYEFMHLHYMLKHQDVPHDWNHYRRNKDGRIISAGLCWNGGYGDFVLAQINEVAQRYPVAGFYIDMLDYPGRDLCPDCRARFRNELGLEAPTFTTDVQSALFKEYRMWTFSEQARYLNRVRASVQEHIPGATVVSNYHAVICEDLYEVRKAVDYITMDPGIGYGYPSGLSRATKFPAVFRALSEGKACSFDILYDSILFGMLEVMPFAPYMSVTANALAHGGWICTCSMWQQDGTLTPAALGLSQAVYRHVDKVRPYVGNWISIKAAGVYLSQETEFLYANIGDKQDRKGTANDACFFGAMMMLEQEHIPIDVLTRRQLGRLNQYGIIILPNSICLSEREVEAFRDYVRNGGTLMASYKTSLADEWGNVQNNFRLADVFGCDYAGVKIEPYLALQMNVDRPEQFPFAAWENPSISVSEAGVKVIAKKGANILAMLHDRVRPSAKPGELPTVRNAWVAVDPLGPAIVENRYGKGRCIYVATKAFAAYVATQVPEIRKLLARWLMAEELARLPVRLRAPGCVKLTAYERPEEGIWIIHLLNNQICPGDIDMSSHRGFPVIEDILPVADLILTVAPGGKRIKKAELKVSGSEIDVRRENGRYVLRIPSLHIHEVLVVEFTEKWKRTPETAADDDPIAMTRCPDLVALECSPQEENMAHDSWNGLGAGQQ